MGNMRIAVNFSLGSLVVFLILTPFLITPSKSLPDKYDVTITIPSLEILKDPDAGSLENAGADVYGYILLYVSGTTVSWESDETPNVQVGSLTPEYSHTFYNKESRYDFVLGDYFKFDIVVYDDDTWPNPDDPLATATWIGLSPTGETYDYDITGTEYCSGGTGTAVGVAVTLTSGDGGGFVVPVDKFGLSTPYIGVASTILVATVATSIYAKRIKHRKERQ